MLRMSHALIELMRSPVAGWSHNAHPECSSSQSQARAIARVHWRGSAPARTTTNTVPFMHWSCTKVWMISASCKTNNTVCMLMAHRLDSHGAKQAYHSPANQLQALFA